MSEAQTQAILSGRQPARASRRRAGRSIGSTIGRVLVFATLAAVVGGGARIGWDRLDEETDAAPVIVPALGEPLGFGVIDPPEMRFADLKVTNGPVTQTYHVNLAQQTYFNIVEQPDAPSVEFVKRDDGVFLLRPVGEQFWTVYDGPDDLDAAAVVVDTFPDSVTVSDALPRAALPFATVLKEEDVPMPQLTGATDVPGTLYRHYRIQVDLARFRQADVGAYTRWFSAAIISDDGRFDVWVDDAGVTRRLEAVLDGGTIAVELLGWSSASERFSQPLTVQAQVQVEVPAANGSAGG